MVPAVVGLWVTVLGVGLSLVALGLVALVGAGLRTGGVRLPRFPLAEPLDREGGSPSGEAAAGVLLLRPGGQVVYASTQARTWFGLQPGEPPHLENLARRVRPVEEFLRLCAVPGQGEVTLARRMFTVISFPLPTVEGAAMALLLRPVSWMPGASSEASDGEAVLERLTTLSRALTDTLGVEETLQAIFQVVDRLLPTDYIEITLWDEETQTLRPYRFVGLAGMEHHLERPQERYPRGEGLTGYLMTHREPLLIPDIRHAEHPALAVSTHRLPAGARAYLGVPLLVGDTVLGTLELAADEAGAFDVGSLRLMQWVAEQAAAALHRALAYTKVQAQVEQLQAQVTVLRSVAALHDAEAFVRHLVEGMHTLTGARLVGLLLYREGSRVLEAQWPFLGVPRAFVDSYRAPLPDDPAVWAPLEKPFWTPNAVEDAWFQRVGLADLARGAGIHDTLVLPLRTEERFLGVLQLSNRADRPFGSEDLALAEAMARQIASVLENFVLLQAQRERAYRAEALRRIANLVASEATLDETFRFVLQELSRLLKASWAAVFLLDESRGVLEVHRPSVVGVAPEVVTRLGQLSVQDPSFAYTVTRTRRPFLSRDIQG
ncbi:MAG TPA: GAF domain-containing protein, partial [Anaerolineales bacterium]|nr:GAF domain-containing protein [Anaerolineales bacterium]